MTRPLICALIALMLSFSCTPEERKNKPIPDTYISPDSMVFILTDMQIAEAAIKLRSTNIDTMQALQTSYYTFIFTKHHTSRDLFKKSFNYYLSRPDTMSHIYEKVLNELSKLEAKQIAK